MTQPAAKRDAQPTSGTRFELRIGKWGQYFHDTQRGGPEGYDMGLDMVLEKLNRLEIYTQRLATAPATAVERDRLVAANVELMPTPEPWMLHDMEFATVVTTNKPGKFIALCDGAAFSDEENTRHAEFIAAAPDTAAERNKLKNLADSLATIAAKNLVRAETAEAHTVVMTVALEMIVGLRQPADNLMSNIEIARAALAKQEFTP